MEEVEPYQTCRLIGAKQLRPVLCQKHEPLGYGGCGRSEIGQDEPRAGLDEEDDEAGGAEKGEYKKNQSVSRHGTTGLIILGSYQQQRRRRLYPLSLCF